MNFRTFISKEEVQQLDIIRFEGDIEVIDDQQGIIDLKQKLRQVPYVGFDTETKPSFAKGEYHDPAIVQIATAEKAYLIRVQNTGYTDSLIDIFEDGAIKKIGISIRDDLRDLQKVRRFGPQGFIDLNHIAERMSISQIGVRSLVGIFLNRRVTKSQQTSNWENDVLTAPQQSYAATDAWVCYRIYDMLERRGFV